MSFIIHVSIEGERTWRGGGVVTQQSYGRNVPVMTKTLMSSHAQLFTHQFIRDAWPTTQCYDVMAPLKSTCLTAQL